MSDRVIGKPKSALLALCIIPTLAMAADEEQAIEEAAEATSELIAYTRVLFDCDMLIESIERSPLSPEDTDLFFITLKTEGVECEQAFAELNDRGRSRGLYFGLPIDHEAEGEHPGGTNLGTILETEPEVED